MKRYVMACIQQKLLFRVLCLVFCMFFTSASAWSWHPLRIGGASCKRDGFRCDTTIGNAGGGGACCDPQSPSIGTCEVQNVCQGGYAKKWANLPMRWSLNVNGMAGQAGYTGLSTSQIETAVKTSFDVWTKPSCTGFQHQYSGQTTSPPSISDNKTILYFPSDSQWAQLGGGPYTLAYALPASDNQGNMFDADIVFNPRPGGASGWGIHPNVQSNQQDFIATAAHEIGHSMGFGHTAPKNTLMYYAALGNGPSFNLQLPQDEINAVCTTYPPTKCTSNSQCGVCKKCDGNGKCVDDFPTRNSKACLGCQTDADCAGGSCLAPNGRYRCFQACTSSSCCPQGYKCANFSGKSICVPDKNVCPTVTCSANTQCGKGETCTGGQCVKSCSQNSECQPGSLCQAGVCKQVPAGGIGDSCANGVTCQSGLQCYTTSKGSVCSRVCGTGSSTTGPGTPGSLCRSGACDSGATCKTLISDQVCVYSCGPQYDCSQYGGTCYIIDNQSSCSCKYDSDCKNGAKCNKSAMGSILNIGTCVTQQAAPCPSGTTCQDPGTGTKICISSAPAPVCGDGTCNGTENCGTCAKDCSCPSGQSCQSNTCQATSTCGNGTCDGTENCGTCAKDCPCPGTQTCQANVCKAPPNTCGNGTCDGTENCGTCVKDCPCPSGQACQSNVCKTVDLCGNGQCDAAENCGTCAKDCPCPGTQTCQANTCKAPPTTCGNGKCDATEDCGACPQDCACETGKACQSGKCVEGERCGDGTCGASENCANCIEDCPCNAGQRCFNKTCQIDPNFEGSQPDAGSPSNAGKPGGPCLPGNKCTEGYCAELDGKVLCVGGGDDKIRPAGFGCTCSVSGDAPQWPIEGLFFLVLLLGLRSLRKQDL